MPSLVLGWLLVAWHLESRAPSSHGADLELSRSAARARGEHSLGPDPGLWNGRELRVLPGIGARRARGVLNLRHAHLEQAARSGDLPGVLVWEEIPGIGGRTADGVRDFLRDRGGRFLEAWTPP